MSTARLRWALIGASTIAGARFVPALRAEGQDVVSVYSSTIERAKRFASEQAIEIASDHLETAMTGVDAVYVSSRNDRHAEQVVRAAAMGKHVFCEKPLALRIEDAVAMLEAAARADIVLAVNHHLRNSEALRAIRAAVREGALGEILSARAQHALLLPEASRGWRVEEPEAGGGVIFDLCVHTVDALRFVLDQEIVEVCAIADSRGPDNRRAEESVVTAQRLSDGVVVSTYESFVAPFVGTAMEVHGTKGSLVGRGVLSVNEPLGEVFLRDGQGSRQYSRGPTDELYRRGIRAFAEAIVGLGEPIATGIDGLRSLAVALAIRDAAATGRRVEVNYPPGCD